MWTKSAEVILVKGAPAKAAIGALATNLLVGSLASATQSSAYQWLIRNAIALKYSS